MRSDFARKMALFAVKSPRRPLPRLLALTLILAGAFLGTPAVAGPNSGGVLLLHAAPELMVSTGMSQCGWSQLRDAKNAVTEVPGDGSPIIFYVIAAFDDFAMPELQGVQFGIEYSSPLVAPFGWDQSNSCADFALPDDGWPASGTGISLTFINPLKRRVNELCWFAAYSYSGNTFKLIAAPRTPYRNESGAIFADGSIPAQEDEAEGLGILGFGVPGFNPMGGDEATGACCSSNGSCSIQTRAGCQATGSSYIGDNEPCFPMPCAPSMGACCIMADCEVMAWDDCLNSGGTFMGSGSCTPSPCNNIRQVPMNWGNLKKIYRR